MSQKNLPISQTEDYFKNLWYRFLEERMLILLALKWNLLEQAFSCEPSWVIFQEVFDFTDDESTIYEIL